YSKKTGEKTGNRSLGRCGKMSKNLLLKTPMDIVAEVVLSHIEEVFKWNYERKNFYLNPETEMYIRLDYPEIDQDHGFKPGVVLKRFGGINEELISVGDQSFLPQDPRLWH